MIALSIVGGVFLFLLVILIICVATDDDTSFHSAYAAECQRHDLRMFQYDLRYNELLYKNSMIPSADSYTRGYTQGLMVGKNTGEYQDRTYKQLRNIERDLADIRQILYKKSNHSGTGLS